MKAADFGSISVVVEFEGVLPPHEVTNWSDDDDCFMFKRSSPSATHKIGCDGLMAVFASSDKSGEFTLKVFQTSPTNKYLNAGLALLENGGATFVPISIQFVDVNREDAIVGLFGYVQKVPDIARGKDSKVQEWVIAVETGIVDLGDPVFLNFARAAAEGQ